MFVGLCRPLNKVFANDGFLIVFDAVPGIGFLRQRESSEIRSAATYRSSDVEFSLIHAVLRGFAK